MTHLGGEYPTGALVAFQVAAGNAKRGFLLFFPHHQQRAVYAFGQSPSAAGITSRRETAADLMLESVKPSRKISA